MKPLKRKAGQKASVAAPTSLEDAVKEALGDGAAIEEPLSVPKKRKVERKKGTQVQKDSSVEDATAEVPENNSEEDRADEFLSKAFLEEETSIHGKLLGTAGNLRCKVNRLKMYLKHFFGSETTETTATGQQIKGIAQLFLQFPEHNIKIICLLSKWLKFPAQLVRRFTLLIICFNTCHSTETSVPFYVSNAARAL